MLDNFEDDYFSFLEEKFSEVYQIAKEARSKGIDAVLKPESMIAKDLAERVEKSVGPLGIANRIRELVKIMPREEVAFKVAEEIASEILGPGTEEKVAEQAIRTALSILDEGVTVSPIEGISRVKIRTNRDRTRYLAVYYAGPIRSAGGTDMGLSVIVADFVRKLMGIERYKATKEEAERFLEELRLYEREVARFQYKIPDSEILNAIARLHVEVNGVQTDFVEVTSFRNLARIETNGVRGGALRVVNDGLIGRARKIVKIVDKLGIDGWDWLNELKFQTEDNAESKDLMFMEDVVAGRPIFSFPNTQGGFRLRYGRCRNTGLAAIGLNPITMHILRNFIASGTQLRIEKPGKAGVTLPVDYIEPPVVKLKEGSIVRVETLDLAHKIEGSIESILFLGDILIAIGEFIENNRHLLPSGFVEEWWSELLRKETMKIEDELKIGIDEERLRNFIQNPLKCIPNPIESLLLSNTFSIPLHPRYNLFWNNIDHNELISLREKFLSAEVEWEDENPLSIVINDGADIKHILEKLCLPHSVNDGNINIDTNFAPILYSCLALRDKEKIFEKKGTITEAISDLSGIKIYDKAPLFIGARMGRPEKAKQREMRPPVHGLFPIGLAGGSRRNILEAAKKNMVSVELERRRCSACKKVSYLDICSDCGSKTEIEYVCPKCGKFFDQEVCPICKNQNRSYSKQYVNVKELLDSAYKKLGFIGQLDLVKGVKGLASDTKKPEPLEKGILRAKNNVTMFKDGTIRFDATNAPLTHFRPAEIGIALEKLSELNYKFDNNGCPVTDSSQLCELKIHDIVIPLECAKYFLKVANFIDDLLEKVYELPPYYKAKSKEDLIGQIVIGLSPHTSVGVIGRIIGFTKNSICLAHPLWHAAKRRDCDGDEDSLSLSLDVLLNFSKTFLPKRIGGTMDAPRLLTTRINPCEVARQVYNMEIVNKFPLAFFEEAKESSDSKKVLNLVEMLYHRVENGAYVEKLCFTHDVLDLNIGNHESVYKRLPSMLDKMKEQLGLAEQIAAVRAEDVAKKVLSTHFMRDIAGNLKAFSSQKFRCKKCNAKFRRPPLKGECPKCGGELTQTVYRGTIVKYLDIAKDLVDRYDLGTYYEQRLRLFHDEINSLFVDEEKSESNSKKEKDKEQHMLSDFI